MNKKLLGIIAVFGAAAAWGMSGIFVTYIIDSSGCSPVALAFWRDFTTFVALILYSLVISSDRLSIRKKDIPWLLSMGFCLGSFHIFYNESIMMNGAAVTTVEQAAMPAVVTIAARYLWNEPLTKEKIIAMIIIFVGTVMASGLNLFALEETNFTGLIVGLFVPVFYAGWTLCGKNIVNRYGAVFCLAMAFGIASITLLPLQPFVRQPNIFNFKAFMSFSGLITFSTIGAFTLYLIGLKYVQAGSASIYAMSEIIFACVYAWFLLNERLTFIQAMGAILVIIGAAWLCYKENSKKMILKKSEQISRPETTEGNY